MERSEKKKKKTERETQGRDTEWIKVTEDEKWADQTI